MCCHTLLALVVHLLTFSWSNAMSITYATLREALNTAIHNSGSVRTRVVDGVIRYVVTIN